jgi:hypothetical protein
VELGTAQVTWDLCPALANYTFVRNDFAAIQGAPLASSFPAEFRLDLMTPPPNEQLNDFTRGGALPDESRFSVGYLLVLHEGKDLNVDATAVAGFGDYVLVYVERDVVPGTISARYLGGALKAGYHLMGHAATSESERAELLAACDPSAGSPWPYPWICLGGDATDKLVVENDELAAKVTILLAGSAAEIQGANIF